MQKIPFAALPNVAKFAIALVPFILWVMFAEFVIDRQGWDEFLPFYRYGELCPWDLGVLLVSGLIWWGAERRARVN
ncbi:hypothetical protein [Altererythrobacter sp. MF3-039]|uniref:hypothetical protein n=1 Tax=Altererythrobacter sp. MF3-039 TaxID=3252901 RepID=UPI00390C938E